MSSPNNNNNNNNNTTTAVEGIEDELQRLDVSTATPDNNDDVVGVSSFRRLLSLISSLQYDDENVNDNVDDSTSTTRNRRRMMNHYSIIPIELQQIYDTIHQQTTLIHNTVTKYTLLQQMVVTNHNDTMTTTTIMSPITKELFQACGMIVASEIGRAHV